MKKLLYAVLSLACLLCCAFVWAACDVGNAPQQKPDTDPEPEHMHSYEWVDNGDGTHKRHCAESGCTEPDIDIDNHDFTNGDCVCGKEKPAPAPPTPTDGLEYKLTFDKESYEVWGIGTATDTEIIIPSEYNGKPVTKIYDRSFENNASIVSVTIPDSVSYIGNLAFRNCTSLERVAVGCGIVFVNNEIFDNCPIETATVPAVICKHINNPKLKTVEITCGEVIAESAFEGCGSLTDVAIPESVKTVGKRAFYNCSALAHINIPLGVTDIGSYAFYGCNSLAEITTDADNTAYASYDGILYNKAKTQFIHIPKAIAGTVNVADSITDVGNGFSGCRFITEIIIPDGVAFIDFGAFYNCTALTEITVPVSVTNIYEDAFASCSALARIKFGGTKAQWSAVSKGYNWNLNTGDFTVLCTDGESDKNDDAPDGEYTPPTVTYVTAPPLNKGGANIRLQLFYAV